MHGYKFVTYDGEMMSEMNSAKVDASTVATQPTTKSAKGWPSRDVSAVIEESGWIGLWSLEGDDRLLRMTPAFGVLFGLDRNRDARWRDLRDAVHPGDRACLDDMESFLAKGLTASCEVRVQRPDGDLACIELWATCPRFDREVGFRAMGVARDVTARHMTQRSDLVGQARLAALMEATAAVVWTVSPDGQALDMPQWLTLTGQSHEDVQGRGWIDAIHPDDRGRVEAAWATAMAHQASYNTDYRVLCADGVYRWYNARGIPILDTEGEIREWIGVCLAVPGRNRYLPASPSPRSAEPQAEEPSRDLTAAQVRAARSMLNWSVGELSRRSGVSASTIHRLEADNRVNVPRTDNLVAIRAALQEGGIEFTFERDAHPGIRPARRAR